MNRVIALRFKDKEYYSELKSGVSVVYGSHKKDDVIIEGFPSHCLTLSERDQSIYIKYKSSQGLAVEKRVSDNELTFIDTEAGEVSFYISIISGKSNTELTLPYSGFFTIGRKTDNDIVIGYPIVSGSHARLSVESNTVHVEDTHSTNGLYLNGNKITKSVMKTGDVLSIYTIRIHLKDGKLFFENAGATLKFSERVNNNINDSLYDVEVQSVQNAKSQYLMYHLSPRIREKMPSDDIILSPVPDQIKANGGRRGNFAFLLSSGAMMAASLATGMISPAMLLARSAGMISPVANMAMYGKLSKEEKKQLEEYEQIRQKKYQEYISDQKARITKIANIQRKILTEENRSPYELIETVNCLQRNLWERMATDSDFLMTRLGIGSVKLCVEVKTKRHDDSIQLGDEDELAALEERIIEETRMVDNAPVCVPMKELQTIGIIGPYDRQVYLLRSLIVELTAQHNYSDVKIVFLGKKESLGRWGILRWLPHIWDETRQVRYISFDDDSRHIICELLEEIVHRRKAEASENSYGKENSPSIPHYVVIVEDRELICHESIYSEITSNNSRLGITTVFMVEDIYELPQRCQYLIDVKDRPFAYYKELLNERSIFVLDESVHQPQMEGYARRLSAIELEDGGVEEGIPNSITFLQGFGALTVKDLDVYSRWENSEPFSSLAAPIGMMNGGKLFSLNIMSGEGAHGPHGLLAGTTGSGKSELLQTWILSMAVNYHPYDVNFVIIDYKGGGMSDLMEPLPHVVGKITNIDRNIKRSLVALKSELKRRQELFSKAGVNNIGKYQRAYKNGEVKEPLPHLIIVTDEFAELKKEEPEFMTELNSVATVGRSLGIHMLLATQKPAGVVTDQINSNSRFRICMKVQDVADSREMLKRPDAAKITQSGRAYYRIGEDEDFGLFQSFYSGSEYIEDKKSVATTENQVRIIGMTGNRINPIKKKTETHEYKDELTAVIDEIKDICEVRGISKMAGPWLPELKTWLPLADLGIDTSNINNNGFGNIDEGIILPIGMYDIPANQKQGIQYLNITELGHCGVFGMPGSGKTMFLKTLLTTMGFLYKSQDINVFVFDAGSWSLSDCSNMPCVKEVVLNQDQKKVERVVNYLKHELETRKTVFVNNAVNSLSAYRNTVASSMPAIIIVVDGIAQMFDQYMQFEDLLMEIASLGSTYGIHLIFTSNTSSGKYKFLQLIKGSIALQLPEKSDYLNLVGSVASVSLPSYPGRALIKGNPPIEVQLAVYSDKADEKERNDDFQAIIQRIVDVQSVSEASVSNNVNEDVSVEMEDVTRTVLSLGTDINSYDTVSVDLSNQYVLLIVGDDSSSGTSISLGIENQLAVNNENQIIHLDSDNCSEMLGKLVIWLNERKKQKKNQVWSDEHTEKDWLAGYTQICLFIDDVDSVIKTADIKDIKTLRRIVTLSNGLGLIVIASCSRELLNKSETDVLGSALVEAANVIGIGRDVVEFTQLKAVKDDMKWIDINDNEGFVICDERIHVINVN